MSTGAKIGLGVGIGCAVAVLAVVLMFLFMGACTCSACSSCCAEISQAAKHAQKMEEIETAKLHAVGETVQMGSISVTVTDAQRQGETVVVTIGIDNEGYTEMALEPDMFALEDSSAKMYAVDEDKASMTVDGIQQGDVLASEASASFRAVFTVPPESTALILEIEDPEYGTTKRRWKLGL